MPVEIRNALNLRAGDTLVWIFDGVSLSVLPLPKDPVAALRGSGKGQRLTEKLLASRRAESAGRI